MKSILSNKNIPIVLIAILLSISLYFNAQYRNQIHVLLTQDENLSTSVKKGPATVETSYANSEQETERQDVDEKIFAEAIEISDSKAVFQFDNTLITLQLKPGYKTRFTDDYPSFVISTEFSVPDIEFPEKNEVRDIEILLFRPCDSITLPGWPIQESISKQDRINILNIGGKNYDAIQEMFGEGYPISKDEKAFSSGSVVFTRTYVAPNICISLNKTYQDQDEFTENGITYRGYNLEITKKMINDMLDILKTAKIETIKSETN